jgi:hypothetical protein
LPQSESEEKMVKESIARGQPLGSDPWMQRIARELALGHTLRPPGRPAKNQEKD